MIAVEELVNAKMLETRLEKRLRLMKYIVLVVLFLTSEIAFRLFGSLDFIFKDNI